jgi:RNA polymerase sigma-70 factor (ECF subfamily)
MTSSRINHMKGVRSFMIDQKTDSWVLDGYIHALAEGDMDAMSRLYSVASPGVYAYALSVLKNKQDAQDVLHDTFVSIYGAADRYRSTGKPMAWIMTIAKNHCYKQLRRQKKTAELSLEDWKDDPMLVASMASDNKLLVEYCMKSLSDKERQIVVLHAVSGFKHREIASLLHVPLPTVLSQYNRAMKKLRTLLEEEEADYDE